MLKFYETVLTVYDCAETIASMFVGSKLLGGYAVLCVKSVLSL